MNFSMTKRTLQSIEQQSNISLEDFMAVMQDVMKDIMNETGHGLSELEVSDEAVRKWMIVARPVLNLPIEQNAKELSERQQNRFYELKEKAEQKQKIMLNFDDDIQKMKSQIERLNSEISSLQNEQKNYEVLAEKEKELKREIDIIKTQLQTYDDVSPEKIQEEYNLLRRQKDENDKKADELNAIRVEQQKVSEELSQRQSCIDAENKKLSDIIGKVKEAEKNARNIVEQQESKNDRLKELEAEVYSQQELNDSAQKKQDEAANRLSVERTKNRLIDEKLQELNDQLAEIDNEIHGKEESKKQLDKQVEEKTADSAALTEEINDLEQKLNELITQIENMSKNQQEMIREIDSKRRSIEESNPEQLQTELKSVTEELENIRKENEDVQNQIEESKTESENLSVQQRIMTQELEQLNNSYVESKKKYENDKNLKSQKQRELEILQSDINEYKKFFNPDFYEKQQQQIESFRKAVELYQEGVRALFGKDIPPDYIGQNADILIKKPREELQSQLNDIENKLNTLKCDYLNIIRKTEQEVNRYAM